MVRGASTRESVPTRGGEGGQGSGGGEPLWSRSRRRTEVEEGEGVVTSWATLSAYRESKLCLAYERTNPSICASFLPRMATTSFQGRSRRGSPLSPCRRMDFSRAPNSAPSVNRPILFIGDRTEIRPGRSTSRRAPSLFHTDFGGGFWPFTTDEDGAVK